MEENVSLSSEEKELLRSVIHKRQASMLWIMGSDQPLSASQRDTIKGMMMDEMRESGGPMSERGGALKKLIDHLAQL